MTGVKGDAPRRKAVVMIGPSLLSHGGMASVVASWQDGGVFQRWPVIYLATHIEGGKARKLGHAIKMAAKFGRLLAAGRVACLHAHVAQQNSFWRKAVFMSLAMLARRPVIVHLHSGRFPAFYAERCGKLGRKIVRIILDRADQIVVLSTHWYRILGAVTFNRNISIVPNFIAWPAPGADEMPVKDHFILYLGQLREDKGFFDLLSAFAMAGERCPGLILKCGGDGDVDEARRAMARLGIEKRVRLLGWVGGQEKIDLLRRATAFVLPSYQEGLPMAVLEAMWSGTAVVATPVGGVPDLVVNGFNGTLVEPGDVAALAAAIVRMVTDEPLRRRMAGRAKIFAVNRFSRQAVLPRIGALYRKYVPDLETA